MSEITKAAKGQPCTVRLPGICNGDSATTVFAHINGGGMALKSVEDDIDIGCFACSACHRWLDLDYGHKAGGINSAQKPREARDLEHYRATIETLKRLIKMGLIKKG